MPNLDELSPIIIRNAELKVRESPPKKHPVIKKLEGLSKHSVETKDSARKTKGKSYPNPFMRNQSV